MFLYFDFFKFSVSAIMCDIYFTFIWFSEIIICIHKQMNTFIRQQKAEV